MFATERSSSICVKSIQTQFLIPKSPFAHGKWGFFYALLPRLRVLFPTYFTSTLQHRTQAHTIFDHGLQMGIAPCFGVLGNVPTLRPRFSHFPPPLCRGASLRIIASPRRSTKNPPQTLMGLWGHMFILCRWFIVVRCSAHALFIQCLDALGQYRHCAM